MNNRRRNFRGRQQKNNFRRRVPSNINNNGHYSNNSGNKSFSRNGSLLNPAGLEKIISKKECDEILTCLKQIEEEVASDQFKWSASLEDVHMNIESALVERIGETGKKLHTARSRNDQVATDMRLYLRDEVDDTTLKINAVMAALLKLAEKHHDSIMPGMTHMQAAQHVTFGHHLLAWAEMLLRDRSRLQDCRQRINVLPLGSAALAGTTFPIDRNYVAKLLGFDEVAQNSLDAVSDRDFIVEF